MKHPIYLVIGVAVALGFALGRRPAMKFWLQASGRSSDPEVEALVNRKTLLATGIVWLFAIGISLALSL
jgi:hypothetical protein